MEEDNIFERKVYIGKELLWHLRNLIDINDGKVPPYTFNINGISLNISKYGIYYITIKKVKCTCDCVSCVDGYCDMCDEYGDDGCPADTFNILEINDTTTEK